jgi:hypothetical protein
MNIFVMLFSILLKYSYLESGVTIKHLDCTRSDATSSQNMDRHAHTLTQARTLSAC